MTRSARNERAKRERAARLSGRIAIDEGNMPEYSEWVKPKWIIYYCRDSQMVHITATKVFICPPVSINIHTTLQCTNVFIISHIPNVIVERDPLFILCLAVYDIYNFTDKTRWAICLISFYLSILFLGHVASIFIGPNYRFLKIRRYRGMEFKNGIHNEVTAATRILKTKEKI